MKRFWKLLKRTLLILTILVVAITVGVVLFVYTAPQFGQSPQGEDLERISKSPHFKDGQFVNLIVTKMGSFSEMMSTMPGFIFGENQEPKDTLPVRFGENQEAIIDTNCYITWYGHSAFLFEMDGKRILIDPMLGETAAPVSFGSKRFPYEKPIPIGDLTDIDVLILSHDHYDHLDYETIIRLKDEVGHFYTALGVGSHLKSWGIPEAKITELDWWKSAELENMELIACPARHFSGRALVDQNTTQWASWVIKGRYQNIYFSGDGGYGPHFKEIGEKHGPFDLALLECGQYNNAWKAIHMMPEESVQAGIDVKAKLIMPIHWGAFKLAVHEWTEPIKRFKAESIRLKAPMIHPFIGERFSLEHELPRVEWWKTVE
jgi:L-ascorbate metabolism protein UlaG (beta-lactamase superfamily)